MKRLLFVVTGAALAMLLVSSSTDAQGTGEIRACANSKGALRILSPGQSCKASETPFTWNVQGPVGPMGPQGAVGPVGPPGPSDVTIAYGESAFMDVRGTPLGGGPTDIVVLTLQVGSTTGQKALIKLDAVIEFSDLSDAGVNFAIVSDTGELSPVRRAGRFPVYHDSAVTGTTWVVEVPTGISQTFRLQASGSRIYTSLPPPFAKGAMSAVATVVNEQ